MGKVIVKRGQGIAFPQTGHYSDKRDIDTARPIALDAGQPVD